MIIFVKKETIMRTGTFFALLTGIAAGVTLGVLFAPESGDETRKKLKKAAEEGCDKIKDASADLKDLAADVADDVSGSAAAAYSVAKDKVSEVARKARVKTKLALRDLSDLKESLKEEGNNLKEDARARLLEQLQKIEDSLRPEEA